MMEQSHIQPHSKLLCCDRLSRSSHCWNEEHSPAMLANNRHNLSGVLQTGSHTGLRSHNNFEVSLCLASGDGPLCVNSNRSSEFGLLNGDQSIMKNIVNSYLCNRNDGSEHVPSVDSVDDERIMPLHMGDSSVPGSRSSSQEETETKDNKSACTASSTADPASVAASDPAAGSPSSAGHTSVPDRGYTAPVAACHPAAGSPSPAGHTSVPDRGYTDPPLSADELLEVTVVSAAAAWVEGRRPSSARGAPPAALRHTSSANPRGRKGLTAAAEPEEEDGCGADRIELTGGGQTHTADGGPRRLIAPPPDLLAGQGPSLGSGPAPAAVPAPVHHSPCDSPDSPTAPPESAAAPAAPRAAAPAPRPDELLLTVRQLRMKLQREMEAKTALLQEVSGLKRRAEQKGGRLTPGRPAADQPDRTRSDSGPGGSPGTPPRSPNLSQTARPVSAQLSPAAADRTGRSPTPPSPLPMAAGSAAAGSPAPYSGSESNLQLQRLSEDVRRLTAERDGAVAQVTRLQREALTAREERERLRRGLHEARAELAALNGERQRRQGEAKEREAQLTRAKHETDALRAEGEKLRAELAARDALISGLVWDLSGAGPAAEGTPEKAERHTTETDGGGGLSAVQWSWPEDADWPAGDQTASEALRLGGNQLTPQTEVTSQDPPASASCQLVTEASDARTETSQDGANASHLQQSQHQGQQEKGTKEKGEEDEKSEEHTPSKTVVSTPADVHHTDFFSDDEDDDLEGSRHDTTPRAALWSRTACRRRHPLRRHVHHRTPLQYIPEQEEPPSDWESDSTDSDGSSGSGSSDGSRKSHRSVGSARSVHSVHSGGGGIAQAKTTRLEETVARLEAERDAAAERAAELDEAVTRLDVELTAVFVECESERRRATEAGRRAEALERERAAVREQRQSAEEAAAGLRAELAEARAERRGLADRLQAMAAENGELLRQLETGRRELARLAELRGSQRTAAAADATQTVVTVQSLASQTSHQWSVEDLPTSAFPPSRPAPTVTDEAPLSTPAASTPQRSTAPSQRLSATDDSSNIPVFSVFNPSGENPESLPAAEVLFSQVTTGGAATEAVFTPTSSPPRGETSPDCGSEASQSECVDGQTFQLTGSLPVPAALACASSATCDSGVDVMDQELDQVDQTEHTDYGFSDSGQADGRRLLSADLGLPTVLPAGGRRRLLLSDHEPPQSTELGTESLSCPDLSVTETSHMETSLNASDSVRGEIRRHLRAAVAAAGEPVPLSVLSPLPFRSILSPGSETSDLVTPIAGRRSLGTPESASQRIARYTELEARRLVDEGEQLRREVDELRRGLLAERGWVAERELLAAQRENAVLLGRLEELTAAGAEDQQLKDRLAAAEAGAEDRQLKDRLAAAEAAQGECSLLRARVAELEVSQRENETLLARLTELETSQGNTNTLTAEEMDSRISDDNKGALDVCESGSHASERKQISVSQLFDMQTSEQQRDSNQRQTDSVEASPAPDSELQRRVESAEESRAAAAADLESARAELAETRAQLQQWVEYCHYWLGVYQPAVANGQAAPTAPANGTESAAVENGEPDDAAVEEAEASSQAPEVTPMANGTHSLEGGEGGTAEFSIPSAAEEGKSAESRLPSAAVTRPTGTAPSPAVQLCRTFGGQCGGPPLSAAAGGPQPVLAGLTVPPGTETAPCKLPTADRIQVIWPQSGGAACGGASEEVPAQQWPTVASRGLFGAPSDDLL